MTISHLKQRLQKLERQERPEHPSLPLAPEDCICQDQGDCPAFDLATEAELERAIGLLRARTLRPARICGSCGLPTITTDWAQAPKGYLDEYESLVDTLKARAATQTR